MCDNDPPKKVNNIAKTVARKSLNTPDKKRKGSDICIGILTCDKTKQRFRRFMKVHQSQFERAGIKYFIIKGCPELEKKGIEYNIVDNYFNVGVRDKYETIAHKLAIFYTYIYENTSYKYVYKIDDGCLANINAILRFPEEHDYIGALMVPTSNKVHMGKCTELKYNKQGLDFRHNFDKSKDIDKNKLDEITRITYAGGGYGYGLSRKALSMIPRWKEHILSIGLSYEDVIFGQIMYLSDIKPYWYKIGKYHHI